MKHKMMYQQDETKTSNEAPTFRRLVAFALGKLSASKIIIGALVLLLGSGLTSLVAQSSRDNRAPEVPADIAVQAGNKVHFHGFGQGVQIYTWDGASWGAAVPE